MNSDNSNASGITINPSEHQNNPPVVTPTANESNSAKPLETKPQDSETNNNSNPADDEPELTLSLIKTLGDLNNEFDDWQNNKDKIKETISLLESDAKPFSIDDKNIRNLSIDQELQVKIASLNNKQAIDDIAKDISFAVSMLTLIKSFENANNIESSYNKEIKMVRKNLLEYSSDGGKTFPIRYAYEKMLTNKVDVEKVIELYLKRSNFDNKIFKESTYDTPNEYSEKAVNWSIKSRSDSKEEKIQVTQIPSLHQQAELEDPTNYCGYYALHNAKILLGNSKADAEEFKTQFIAGLKYIAKKRKTQKDLDLSDSNILRIAELDYAEIVELAHTLKIGVDNLDFESAYMMLAQDDNPPVIPNIIRKFIETYKDDKNIQRHTFIGNTSENGSHWMAFSLEKKNGKVFMNLMDSLARNRKNQFKEWFPK